MIKYTIVLVLFSFGLNAQITYLLEEELGYSIEVVDSKEDIPRSAIIVTDLEKQVADIDKKMTLANQDLGGDEDVLSKTSIDIYESLGRPNAESTLKNKYRISDWTNFVKEYQIDIDIEDMKESEIIENLLKWRKEN